MKVELDHHDDITMEEYQRRCIKRMEYIDYLRDLKRDKEISEYEKVP